MRLWIRRGRSAAPDGDPSAFDVILKRKLTISQSGRPREVTVEEALQHRTLEDALAGNRTARREVLRMIAERERWRATRPPPEPERGPRQRNIEDCDPRNADEAMVLLGIAIPDPQRRRWDDGSDDPVLLARWAVQAALERRRGPGLSPMELEEIERCTEKHASEPPFEGGK